MLQPLSNSFFVLDEGADDLVFVPKAQIQSIEFDRSTGVTSLDLASQPTLNFQDTERNLRRTLAWRDVGFMASRFVSNFAQRLTLRPRR